MARRAKMTESFLLFAQGVENEPQIVMSVRESGILLERRLIGASGLGGTLQILQEQSQIKMGRGVFGSKLHGRSIMALAFLE